MSKSLLSLEDVHTHVEGFHILQGVSFEVPENQVVVLLGRNGAGKSTTLRTIMGLWAASAGSIVFRDQSLRGVSTAQIARAGVAYVPENMGIFSGLTVRQNLLLATRTGRFDPDRLDWLFSIFPPLHKYWNFPAGKLSGGQKQMVSIGRAMVEKRSLILVDEPTKGIAPLLVESLFDAFLRLKQMNTTLLLVEQNLSFASELGDSVVVMDEGRVVHTGSMETFARDTDMQSRYLGLSFAAPQSPAETEHLP
ncbi:ABC transporter ATP-binding protein [Alcaligenaceae bacterium]|nr:ABC transporter ATP-binding protein [Alcaligenaceae bacterium]